MKSSVADPVHFFRIRMRGSGFKNTDPDPEDSKKTGSDRIRIRIILRYVFDVKQNKQWHFLTKSKHFMTLKIKDKKIVWTKLYFRQFFTAKKLHGSFCA